MLNFTSQSMMASCSNFSVKLFENANWPVVIFDYQIFLFHILSYLKYVLHVEVRSCGSKIFLLFNSKNLKMLYFFSDKAIQTI